MLEYSKMLGLCDTRVCMDLIRVAQCQKNTDGSIIIVAGPMQELTRPCTEVNLFLAFSGKEYFNFFCWAKGQMRVDEIKSL